VQQYWKDLLNFFAFTLLTVVACGFQSSMWYQFFGYTPAPQLWISILVYWTLNRKLWEGSVMLYLIAFIVSSQSAVPFSILLTSCVGLFVIGLTIKQRVYWPGPQYFMMMSAFFSFVFPLFHYFVSFLVEDNAISSFYFFRWVATWILTGLFSFPFFFVLEWVDKKTQKEKLVDVSGGDF